MILSRRVLLRRHVALVDAEVSTELTPAAFGDHTCFTSLYPIRGFAPYACGKMGVSPWSLVGRVRAYPGNSCRSERFRQPRVWKPYGEYLLQPGIGEMRREYSVEGHRGGEKEENE